MGRGRGLNLNSKINLEPTLRRKKSFNSDNFLNHQNQAIQSFKDLSKEDYSQLMIELGQGKFSERNGRFLAKEDNFLDIIETDTRSLNNHGITPAQVGVRLAEIIEPFLEINRYSKDKLITKNNVPDHIEVIGHSGVHKGFQDCPFQKCGVCESKRSPKIPQLVSLYKYESLFGAFNCGIYNKKTNEHLKCNAILSHLIADHNFFEGNVPHRVDPIKLAKILELI